MDTSLNARTLTLTAIDALKTAYEESTSHQAKQAIATAYTAITLLNYVTGRDNVHRTPLDFESGCDPSEYCAAI